MEVTLTTESKVKLAPDVKMPFTYEVVWTESSAKFADRFDKYLDPNFFQHRVSGDALSNLRKCLSATFVHLSF